MGRDGVWFIPVEGGVGAGGVRIRASAFTLALLTLPLASVGAFHGEQTEVAFSATAPYCYVSTPVGPITTDHCSSRHAGVARVTCESDRHCTFHLAVEAHVENRVDVPFRWQVRFHDPQGEERWRIRCDTESARNADACAFSEGFRVENPVGACLTYALQTPHWQADRSGAAAETVFTLCNLDGVLSLHASDSRAREPHLRLP